MVVDSYITGRGGVVRLPVTANPSGVLIVSVYWVLIWGVNVTSCINIDAQDQIDSHLASMSIR